MRGCFMDPLTSTLIVTQIITGFLFILSEILGSSSCRYNGVFQFVFDGCLCMDGKKLYIDVRIEEILDDSSGESGRVFRFISSDPEVARQVASWVSAGLLEGNNALQHQRLTEVG